MTCNFMELVGQGCTGVFGGSFNPPHMGHVLACHYALMRWGLAKVLIVPSFKHPFGKYLPDFEKRMEMCHLAFKHLGCNIEISDVERQLSGVGYSIDTISELKRQRPDEQFRFLVGGDILADTNKWHRFDELVSMSPLLVIPRISNGEIHGGEAAEAALPEVDSTSIRNALAGGETPHGTLPLAVLRYIRDNGMYQDLK